jgi:hypothetical protein
VAEPVMVTTRFPIKLIGRLFLTLGVGVLLIRTLHAAAIAESEVAYWGPLTTEQWKIIIDSVTFVVALGSFIVALKVYLQKKGHIGLDAATFYNNITTFQTDRTWTLFNSFARNVNSRYPKITEKEIKELSF